MQQTYVEWLLIVELAAEQGFRPIAPLEAEYTSETLFEFPATVLILMYLQVTVPTAALALCKWPLNFCFSSS